MKRQMQQAITLYESFRDAKPKKLARLKVNIPKIVACMGYVESLDYRTTHKGKAQPYRHRFAPGSRPLLCVSSDGRQLMLLGGLYKWTERGIVDRDSRGRERPDPKHGRGVNPGRGQRGNFKMMDLPDDGTITMSRLKVGTPWIVTRVDKHGMKVPGGQRRFKTLQEAGEYAWGVKMRLAARLAPFRKRRNPRVLDLSDLELMRELQTAYNEHDTARLKMLGAEQVRRSKLFRPAQQRK